MYILLLIAILIGGYLRFNQLSTNPPGLYIDEASIGYNAYKILSTGKDEHGEKYPLFFKAFGEYKLPVYIYATVVSMDIFGKNEFAIRFPSALLGTVTIPALYILTKKTIHFYSLTKKNIFIWAPLLSSVFLAISPWHIHFSRGGFEANVALFFLVVGLDLFLIALESKKRFIMLLFSFIILLLPLYTYQAYRIITPVIILFCMGWIYKERNATSKQLLLIIGILSIFCFPLIQFFFSSAGSARFAQVSAFDTYQNYSLFQKIIIYPTVFVKNYLSFYSAQFLFISGDGIGRHQIPNFGLIPLWQVIFIIVGFYSILKHASSKKYFIIVLFFLSTIPGALTVPSPHALRSLLIIIPIEVFATYGVLSIYNYKNKLSKLCVIAIFVFAIYETFLYFHFYYSHYPKTNELDWGAQYKEVITQVSKYKKNYKYLVVDTNIGSSAIYFSFYNESLNPMFSDKIWQTPKGLQNKEILFVGGGEKVSNIKILDTVYMQNKNRDIFAQIWIKQ